MKNNLSLELKGVSFSAGFWTITSKFSNAFFSGLITLISSKFITAQQFGEFVSVMLIINFFIRLAEAGIPPFLIKTEKLEKDLLSNCFFVNIFNASFLIVLTNFLIFPFLNLIFNSDQVIILRMLSILILTDSISSLLNSTKERKFENKTISFISFFAEIISVTFSIILFLEGYEIWGLVFYLLIKSITRFLLFLLIYRLQIEFSFNLSHIKKIYSFTFPISISSTLEYLNEEYIKIISSLVLSAADFGILAMSFKLLNTVHSFYKSFNRSVTLPLLSIAKRNDPRRILDIFLKLRYLISSFAYPIFCYLFSSNQIFIDNLLNSEWEETSKIIFLLSIGSFFISFRYTLYPYLIVKNKLKVKIIFPIIRFIILSAFIFLVSNISIINLVISFVVIEFIISSLSLIVISKIEKISYYQQLVEYSSLVYASFIAIFSTLLFNNIFDFTPWLDFIFSLLINFVIFYTAFFLIDKKELLEDYKFIFKKLLFKN